MVIRAGILAGAGVRREAESLRPSVLSMIEATAGYLLVGLILVDVEDRRPVARPREVATGNAERPYPG